MVVSGVQQTDSIIYIHVSILFQILSPFRLLENTEQRSLCYAVGPRWLSILNIAVCTFEYIFKADTDSHPDLQHKPHFQGTC